MTETLQDWLPPRTKKISVSLRNPECEYGWAVHRKKRLRPQEDLGAFFTLTEARERICKDIFDNPFWKCIYILKEIEVR